MKQILTVPQSAYLMKLEYSPPVNTVTYTLGELMKIIPKTISTDKTTYCLNILSNDEDWTVDYHDIKEVLYMAFHEELIDALFKMLVILAERNKLN